MTNIALSLPVTLTLIFSTIMYEGTLNERIRSTLKLRDSRIILINLETDKERWTI